MGSEAKEILAPQAQWRSEQKTFLRLRRNQFNSTQLHVRPLAGASGAGARVRASSIPFATAHREASLWNANVITYPSDLTLDGRVLLAEAAWRQGGGQSEALSRQR